MEYNIGSHAYLSRSAQKHCVSLGPLRTRHQDRFGCARRLFGEETVKESEGARRASRRPAVPAWSLVKVRGRLLGR